MSESVVEKLRSKGGWAVTENEEGVLVVEEWVADPDCQEAALLIENYWRLVSFFHGADPTTGDGPSISDVLRRFRESWDREESVPLAALTIVACLSIWAEDYEKHAEEEDG